MNLREAKRYQLKNRMTQNAVRFTPSIRDVGLKTFKKEMNFFRYGDSLESKI
ncbi:hypothetical protein GCM10011396_46020 [Undibacterium terreum]|uniref:Uncharacterized protein n=1 Tax=Undibacterium terreum TaxID=1224302 RepID=A0A916UYH8_9BURK|nr:hypothetical protein GCM10011396_46020 [Undibacterium terreum]